MNKTDGKEIHSELCTKKYYDNNELLEKVKLQNIKINDKNIFFKEIDKIGYYKLINGYRKPFGSYDSDVYGFIYDDNVTFSDLLSLYYFDFDLRMLTFKYITIIENKIKNAISNTISSEYGTDHNLFLQNKNFDNQDKCNKVKKIISDELNNIIKKYEDSLNRNNKPKIINNSIIHYYNNYSGAIPFWSISNILSFGKISRIYSNLKDFVQQKVSKKYNLYPAHLKSYLENLNLFRNICAHNEKLYSFKTQNALKITNIKELYVLMGVTKDINNNEHSRGIKDYLSLVVILKMLLSDSNFKDFYNQLLQLLEKLRDNVSSVHYNSIIKIMGLHDEWEKVIEYKKTLKRKF